MKPSPTAIALKLAARACGTNTPELAERLGIKLALVSGTLSNLMASGRMHCVEGEVQPQGIVLHQYFASKRDADAWAKLAPMYRPNVRLKKSSRSSTSGKPQRQALARGACL